MVDLKKKARGWAWTLFDYKLYEQYLLDRFKEYDLQYVTWGKEICPKTQRGHLQGFVYFYNAVKGETVKKILFGKAHVEKCYASARSNDEYCGKGGSVFSWGTLPMQGKRSDLVNIYRMLQDGATNQDILAQHPGSFIRYHGGIEKARLCCVADRDSPPIFSWYWGPSGVGKTSGAIEECPDSYYIKDSTKWWNGYEGQELVIVDDLKADDYYSRIGEILKLTDRYKFSAEVKGGYLKINCTMIIVTCDRHPCKLWPKKEDLAQVMRRIEQSGGMVKRVASFEPYVISEEKMKEFMQMQ